MCCYWAVTVALVCMRVCERTWCTVAPLFRKERATLLWVGSPTQKGLLFISEQININYDIILPPITKLTVHQERKRQQNVRN